MELHILFGATARGKTKQAQALWKRYHYPIISVDSRKVYRGADIGTNKLSLVKFMTQESVELVGGIDFLSPTEEISAFRFQQYMYSWINEHSEAIAKSGGLILHGGTGLYLDALLEGKDLRSPRNSELREKLQHHSVEELQIEAKRTNQEKYVVLNESDRLNPRRLIRFIENNQGIVGNVPEMIPIPTVIQNARKIWYDEPFDRAELYETINKRVERYLEEGWLSEVEQLLLEFGASAPALQMMGYKQLVEFMQQHENWQEKAQNRDEDFEAVLEAVKQAHRRYAKRQITWAKKYRVS